jgi:hypothetical protein
VEAAAPEKMTKPNLKDLLLEPEARTEALVPARRKHRHRAALDLD